MPQLTHSFLPRAWGRANTRGQSQPYTPGSSVTAESRNLTEKTAGEALTASPAGRAGPKPLNAARWHPQTPELLLSGAGPHRPDRPAAALGQGRHAGGLAGGQGAGGLPRRPRGPQDGGGTRLSPPRRLSGSLPFPPQPARQRQTARRGAEGRSGAAAPTLRPGVGEGSTARPPRRRPPDPAWLGRVPDSLPLNLRSEGGSRTRICSCFAMAPEADAIGDSAERGRARGGGSLAGAGDGVGAGSAEL